MPWNDGIDRKFCFSVTDFHEFDHCPFRFFVFHHLNKKYELSEGSEQLALGCLLDQAIKIFHSSKAYGSSPDYAANLVQAACAHMKDKVRKQTGPSFYSAIEQFLTPELCARASVIFKNYYLALNGKIKPSIAEIGFCEWIITTDDGVQYEQSSNSFAGQTRYKLWGGPDALEMGDDGIPEVVDYKSRTKLDFSREFTGAEGDYKSRENIENGKIDMDMDLMPKIYTLLCSNKLLKMGYKKARFVVRFWQDPMENSFVEEFDLEEVCKFEEIFKARIKHILETTEVKYCEKVFCRACNSDKRGEFLRELEGKRLIKIDDSLLFAP